GVGVGWSECAGDGGAVAKVPGVGRVRGGADYAPLKVDGVTLLPAVGKRRDLRQGAGGGRYFQGIDGERRVAALVLEVQQDLTVRHLHPPGTPDLLAGGCRDQARE